MRTPREYYPKNPIVYTFELNTCPECAGPLNIAYTSTPKVVQTMGGSDDNRPSPPILPGP